MLLFTVLLASLLAACSSGQERSLKPSPDWSRGVKIGTNLVGTIGLVVEEQGGNIHLVWPAQGEDGVLFHYVQINRETAITAEHDLDLDSTRLRTPRLLPAGAGRLHLFYGNRTAGGGDWGLWYTQLDAATGEIASAPFQISTEDVNVSDYTPAPDGQGGAVVLFARDGQGDVFGARLGPSGELLQEQTLLAEGGRAPTVRVGQDQTFHVAWLQENDVVYSSMAAGELTRMEGVSLTNLRSGTGLSILGPELGLDHTHVYVFWSQLFQSGTEAGTAATEYISFPLGAARPSNSVYVGVMPVEEPPLKPYDGFFNLTQLVPAPEKVQSSEFVYQPSPIYTDRAELAIALIANQQVRRDIFDQPVVSIFADGIYQGYLNAGKTISLSKDPILIADAEGELYMAWREGAAGQHVYFATTLAEMRELWDQVTFLDVLNAALLGGLEGAATMLCFPIAGIGWMLPGLLLLGGWKLAREQEDLSQASSWILLTIAFLVYQFIKLLTIPALVSYIPFSAWVEIPPDWETALRIGVPLVIFGISVGVAEFVRRRRTQSTLVYYIVLTVVDGLLTLGIYGVTFLGVG